MAIISKEEINKQRADRVGERGVNNQGCSMIIKEYINSKNIIVQFQDKYKAEIHTTYSAFKKGNVRNPFKYFERIGEKNINTQGCLMKIIEYINAQNIIVEFQDEYKARIKTSYYAFVHGNINNPYFPSVCDVGMIGEKYPSRKNGVITKEYDTWKRMLHRCFDENYKNRQQTYKDVTCCKEWLLFDNFYEWLHNQENFDKWYNGNLWAIDKDILIKNNKIYSPETCCLVPNNVNSLFIKKDMCRGSLPIGVYKYKEKYRTSCNNPFTGIQEQLGDSNTSEQAFQVYKLYKENIIKQVAEIEYNKNNITKQCYEAMMNYEVEITD